MTSILQPPDQIQLPKLVFEWHPGRGLHVMAHGHGLTPYRHSGPAGEIFIFGSPVLDGRINPAAVAAALQTHGDCEALARRLDGQFLLLRTTEAGRHLTWINDRFTSFPVYFARTADGTVIGSLLYADLFRRLKKEAAVALKQEALFEVVWLQRLLGTTTLDTLSQCLAPASVVECSASAVRSQRYWRPDFSKREGRSAKEAGAEFSEILTAAIDRKTSDPVARRYGHFLSGGHDSRLVLSAFRHPPHCFTVGFSDNYEIACARQAANLVGAGHSYLALPQDYLTRYQDVLADLCGGLYATDNAIFAGLEPAVQAQADVVFHGHGFDYLFQGMYVPANVVHWFGRPTFFRTLRPIDGDMAQFYLQNIPFGLGRENLLQYVLPEQRQNMADWMMASVQAVIADGAAGCHTDYDRWEYLVTHNLCRHYSHPNIISKWTCAEPRAVSFDNAVFDFYLSMPVDLRLNGDAMREALHRLNPALARLATGNTGFPAGASALEKTSRLVLRKLMRHLSGNNRLRAPHAEDRTWPDRDTYMRRHPAYRAMALEAVYSDLLADAMPYLDWPLLRQRCEDWLQQSHGGAKLMVSLMSLHRFLARSV